MPTPPPEVVHNTARQRFECTVDGHLNVADYLLSNGLIVLTHTAVHPSLRGRGIGAALIGHALDFARAEHLKVDPACTYAAAYMQRHPETRSLHA